LATASAARKKQKFLVADLRRAISDISLLTVEGMLFELLATAARGHFGGEHLHNGVVDHSLDVFGRRTGKDASGNATAVVRLNREARKASPGPCTSEETLIELDQFLDRERLSEPLMRSRFA
jgi:heat shock protein 5